MIKCDVFDSKINRIDKKFKILKKENKKAFIAYITAFDPDIVTTFEIIRIFAEEGVDIIELGVPFSDPVGDGCVNQSASERALKNKITIHSLFKCLREFRKIHDTPIVLFTYMNPIYQLGYENFAEMASCSGIDGVLTVDGPFDMCQDLNRELKKKNIHNIFLVAPNTSNNRLKKIIQSSNGFIYCVSSYGVTGMRSQFSQTLPKRIQMIRKMTEKPVCVGFGISTPEKAKSLSKISDGVIVGSAFVKMIEKYNRQKEKLYKDIRCFTKNMVAAVKIR